MTLTLAEIERLEKLGREATAGEWQTCDKPEPSWSDHGRRQVALTGVTQQYLVWIPSERVGELKGCSETNAQLIAALRNAAPALLQAARRLRELESALSFLHDNSGHVETVDDECVSTRSDGATAEHVLQLARDLGWQSPATGEKG
jgi:hypothetical protein